MWRVLLTTCALLSASTPAAAAEWWPVSSSGDTPNRRVGFIDKTSFVSDYAGRISAWEFDINESPEKDGVRKEKTLHRFDCKNRTMTLLEVVKYGNNDRLIDTVTWNSYEQTENNIIPDSVGESKWQFVCEGKSIAKLPLNGSPEQFAAYFFRYGK